MHEKIRKLREERMKIWEGMKALLNKAEEEDRDLTAEEDEQYRKMEDDFDNKTKEIERMERLLAREDEINKDSDALRKIKSDGDGGDDENRKDKVEEERRAAFNKFLARGIQSLAGDEIRALQADSDIYGGYLVAPQQFVTELIKAVDNQVFIRQYATVYTLTRSESLGVPSLDNDPADADWTKELGIGTEDSTMSFGKRELRPHPLAKLLKVSEKLLRISAVPVEPLVRDRLSYKFAVTHENAFLNGDGGEKPLGLFTASDDGISTNRDVSTGNTTTSIKTDGLIEALYTLKPQYHPRARWIFHRDAIKQIRKLKDGDGQYIWQPGVSADRPDVILGRPYHMSEYAPNTFTTGQYVGIIGDLSFYWIVDALEMRIQRLNELYAATNQVGFIGRLETDGMPVLEEAFVRVKLA